MANSNTSSTEEDTQQQSQGGLGNPQQSQQKQSTTAQQSKQPSLFSRPRVKQQFKAITLMFIIAGAGYAGSTTLVLMQLGEEQLLYLGGVIVPATISMMFITPTIIGAIAAAHSELTLEETGTDLYTAVALPVFIGSMAFMAVTTVILGFEVETGLEISEMLVPFAAAAAPAAATSAGIAWALD